MKKEKPILTDYNMAVKLIFMPLFILLCVFPILMIICIKNIGFICFFLFAELIMLAVTVYIYTNHVSVYTDRIETSNIFSKETVLFKAIKKLDIKLVQESYRGKKYGVLYSIFFGNHGQEILKLRVKSTPLSILLSTARISDIISIIENYNKKIEISKNFIKYLNENTNYKRK
ncbi:MULTISPECIES: hypothetical protein [unclassified Clostridium]|uniref:hypothetical protein n=1 Tax=unclassified Clostridium TaxID=2614128 RepID=UPI0002983B96|nr:MULTISPECIES: hypothetical protein [unclassified Clostridium]EKQ56109.1 MAG: hypothetical protein A370_02331 [Clostridium sp. Maddingley MBC34-26]